MDLPKRKLVFQPSIFRGYLYVSFTGCIFNLCSFPHGCFFQPSFMEFHLIFGHVSSSRNQQELFRHPGADSGKTSLPTLISELIHRDMVGTNFPLNHESTQQPVTPEVWPNRINPWRFLKGSHSSRGYPTWQTKKKTPPKIEQGHIDLC